MAETEETRNRNIIKDFVNIVTKEKDVDAAAAKYISPNYIEHNPDGASGIEGFKGLWKLLTAPEAVTETKRIAADGNLVFTHGKGFWDGKNYAFADIYRLEDGKIVEHWDVLQEIPTSSSNPQPLV
jgi:predicted SnoaL-like aldol condensation-catalyzing enzyme